MTTSRDGAVRPSACSTREDMALNAGDHELMAGVAVGDVQAYACLVGRHVRTMTALAQRMTGNASDADDVAQEAFLRLWMQAPRWDPYGPAQVRTWLSRVVVNLCLDRGRKRKPLPLEAAGGIVDPAAGGFENAHLHDKQRVVQSLLRQLPERQRAAVVLSYFEDLSGQEIARAMQLSAGAVESLLVRARRALRKGMLESGLKWGEDI
ncbi:MAG: RNA polymerase sigma factor [Alphaproteobacteria bacterium]|nr:RNA polymerase sigma factor [Alphaproteobacteria bacterium]